MPEADYGGYDELNDDHMKGYMKSLSANLHLDVYCLDYEKNQSRISSQVFLAG